MDEVKFSNEFWSGRNPLNEYTPEEYIDIQSGRIKDLESGLRTVLDASELWLPAQGELLSEEFASEAQALCEMYSNLKQLLNKGKR